MSWTLLVVMAVASGAGLVLVLGMHRELAAGERVGDWPIGAIDSSGSRTSAVGLLKTGAAAERRDEVG